MFERLPRDIGSMFAEQATEFSVVHTENPAGIWGKTLQCEH